ncbi:MAG: hypothetical protein LIO67_05305 [Lachnospiraceae bacterium]|nr:hypothetical protein [Lachnospiraceae bacterium]
MDDNTYLKERTELEYRFFLIIEKLIEHGLIEEPDTDTMLSWCIDTYTGMKQRFMDGELFTQADIDFSRHLLDKMESYIQGRDGHDV